MVTVSGNVDLDFDASVSVFSLIVFFLLLELVLASGSLTKGIASVSVLQGGRFSLSSILASLFASTSCGILLDSSLAVGYGPNLNVTGFFSANCHGFFAVIVSTFASLWFENRRFDVSVLLYYRLLVSI